MYWTFENYHNCFSAIHSIVQFLKLRDPKIMSKFLNQACAGLCAPGLLEISLSGKSVMHVCVS